MTHPQAITITILVFSFFASYLLAAEFGFDFFKTLLSFLVQLPFRCFLLFFATFGPLVQEASRRKRFIPLLRVWNFAIDCVVSGSESVVFLLDKLGLDDEEQS
jgi:hypothetical protein